MSVLDDWINPLYLERRVVEDIRQSVIAKPVVKYAVLDNFFKEEKLERVIAHHRTLSFSEEADRRSHTGEWLPYDGAVVFAKQSHVAAELLFDSEWHQYCGYLTNAGLQHPATPEIKLRYHRPYADGFWIHTDSAIRHVVIITYFNKDWTVEDGGLLQLWRMEETMAGPAFAVDHPKGRLEFLLSHQRIRTSTPGGGFPDGRAHDLVLIDQIVPCYNRVFLCDLRASPAYHSVTPSAGRERLGIVQWLS